ncbi:MAG: 5-methyltetrahydropteroyltriglutamate--homocysteine S-methyltransferase [Gammaproteobacteria bacterium AqS3]|nr:5-methyltetrahydropteroyltriglutamate--homocysteine S-methyltransferase [Gammaproteobacteria bacterium AqS3]
MAKNHNLGFPRIGARRELKMALEAYWAGQSGQDELLKVGSELRKKHWQLQADMGIELVPVGDFAFYDQVLNTSCMLGAVPPRFGHRSPDPVDLDTMFRMARGRAPSGADAAACEMTKWFDTNYHYLVPEFDADQQFHLGSTMLQDELAEAEALGIAAKPVLLGPLSYLWLGKNRSHQGDKLELLERLLPVYRQILDQLGERWVQIDEPVLCLDLSDQWREAFAHAYQSLSGAGVRTLLATYFGALRENMETAAALPIDGLHLDGVRAPEQLVHADALLRPDQVLSAGVINGRNVWRSDCASIIERLRPLQETRGDRLWVAPSCSLLHTPVDLDQEDTMDPQVREWLAFAVQKVREISLITQGLNGALDAEGEAELDANSRAVETRRSSPLTHREAVRSRMAGLSEADYSRRSPYSERAPVQRARLDLPLFPTTTIGSFPQTEDIRRTRAQLRTGEIDQAEYEARMRAAIEHHISEQIELDLDVLVHGEAERNDMVEYFGELLGGYAVSRFGWVQSYGSRCVKPPILYGDVYRPEPMTVQWIQHAQSLSERPVKGMLTGPITMLCWSFVRDDQPLHETAGQLALAIRDEVRDLEAAGIGIIQVDEPALREGLPLRRSDWSVYLDWAVRSFRLSVCVAEDATQIHSHMCYSEFNDIMQSIADMDADVITIENSRSDMELLASLTDFEYPNDIGPGVYDIHSPLVPEREHIVELLDQICRHLPAERVWVNPDCGLKTRAWPEVRSALGNMVEATKIVRRRHAE